MSKPPTDPVLSRRDFLATTATTAAAASLVAAASAADDSKHPQPPLHKALKLSMVRR